MPRLEDDFANVESTRTVNCQVKNVSRLTNLLKETSHTYKKHLYAVNSRDINSIKLTNQQNNLRSPA